MEPKKSIKLGRPKTALKYGVERFSLYPAELGRFWSKVQYSEHCWNWRGKLNASGYGLFVVGHSKTHLAHRVAYREQVGAIPGDRVVMHTCDNRRCVRPSHLLLGSVQDNHADMVTKGRHVLPEPRSGAANPMAVITPEIAAEIRARYKPRVVTLKVLAAEYGISEASVSLIVNGKRWQ